MAFFDVGSTIVDEHLAYEHRMREIADSAIGTRSLRQVEEESGISHATITMESE